MNKKIVSEVRGLLGQVQVGMQKLAELTALEAKQASSPAADPAVVGRLAETIAAKMASMGVGQPTDVAYNASYMATDQLSSLQAMQTVLDHLSGPGKKSAEAPAGLGQPVGGSVSRAEPNRSYMPIRC